MPLPTPSDELLAACRAGDREAFASLFDACRDPVYAVALGICGNRSAAADVAQEVFMKLLTRLPQFAARASFGTWLYRIVVNAALDHRRAAARLASLSRQVEDTRRLDDEYARAERRRRIDRAVQTLPPKLRLPLVLRHVEGLQYGDIARVLGVSAGTVASRLARAHARLARQLSGEVS